MKNVTLERLLAFMKSGIQVSFQPKKKQKGQPSELVWMKDQPVVIQFYKDAFDTQSSDVLEETLLKLVADDSIPLHFVARLVSWVAQHTSPLKAAVIFKEGPGRQPQSQVLPRLIARIGDFNAKSLDVNLFISRFPFFTFDNEWVKDGAPAKVYHPQNKRRLSLCLSEQKMQEAKTKDNVAYKIKEFLRGENKDHKAVHHLLLFWRKTDLVFLSNQLYATPKMGWVSGRGSRSALRTIVEEGNATVLHLTLRVLSTDGDSKKRLSGVLMVREDKQSISLYDVIVGKFKKAPADYYDILGFLKTISSDDQNQTIQQDIESVTYHPSSKVRMNADLLIMLMTCGERVKFATCGHNNNYAVINSAGIIIYLSEQPFLVETASVLAQHLVQLCQDEHVSINVIMQWVQLVSQCVSPAKAEHIFNTGQLLLERINKELGNLHWSEHLDQFMPLVSQSHITSLQLHEPVMLTRLLSERNTSRLFYDKSSERLQAQVKPSKYICLIGEGRPRDAIGYKIKELLKAEPLDEAKIVLWFKTWSSQKNDMQRVNSASILATELLKTYKMGTFSLNSRSVLQVVFETKNQRIIAMALDAFNDQQKLLEGYVKALPPGEHKTQLTAELNKRKTPSNTRRFGARSSMFQKTTSAPPSSAKNSAPLSNHASVDTTETKPKPSPVVTSTHDSMSSTEEAIQSAFERYCQQKDIQAIKTLIKKLSTEEKKFAFAQKNQEALLTLCASHPQEMMKVIRTLFSYLTEDYRPDLKVQLADKFSGALRNALEPEDGEQHTP